MQTKVIGSSTHQLPRIRFANGGTEKQSSNFMQKDQKPGVNAPTKSAILLVDDEKPLLDVFAAALAPHFEISTASNAREADFILQKKNFKVVVADHLMPGGNGMNFLVRAREDFPHMQRILVTGYMKPEMLLRSVNEAALFRYLLKPVSMMELIKVVQDAAKAHDVAVAMEK
jgi:DNA-binding NtrC family response regulator